MTKMSRYALITALAMFLAGCVGQREPAPVEEVKPAPEQPAEPHCEYRVKVERAGLTRPYSILAVWRGVAWRNAWLFEKGKCRGRRNYIQQNYSS